MRGKKHSDEELLALFDKHKDVGKVARMLDYSAGYLQQRLSRLKKQGRNHKQEELTRDDFVIVKETGTYERFYLAKSGNPIKEVEEISDLQTELTSWIEFNPEYYSEEELIEDSTIDSALRKIV